MEKLAQQQDDQFLNKQISSDKANLDMWNKYFADKHKNAISSVRAVIQHSPTLKTVLIPMFPGYKWQEFADMPTQSTFGAIADNMRSLIAVPEVKQSADAQSAIKAYLDLYNQMLNKVESPPPQASKAPEQKPAKRKSSPSPKVKQLQQLLHVSPTGVWNAQSNAAFLNWLKTNGWDKYISGNRFIGKIDDAIRAMLIEKADSSTSSNGFPVGGNAPGQETIDSDRVTEGSFAQKQLIRMKSLNKLASSLSIEDDVWSVGIENSISQHLNKAYKSVAEAYKLSGAISPGSGEEIYAVLHDLKIALKRYGK